MKTLFSLFLVGLIIAPLLPLASAHGVCVQLQPRFGRLDDVSISNRSIKTGDTITITGNITSLVKKDLLGYLSIHSSPSPHARWVVMSTEPSEKMINVTQFSEIPFSMTIKALQPGTYKLSPMLYSPEIGPAFGILNGCNTEPVVTVTGKSICNTGFVSILKAEDDSSFCVKPDTAQKLIERGWAMKILSNSTVTESMKTTHKAPCLSQEINQTIVPGLIHLPSCPIILFNTNTAVIAKSGFVGVYNYTNIIDDYVLEPGHNGTITYTIVANHPEYSGPILNQKIPTRLNFTNYAIFSHSKTIQLDDIGKYPEISKHSGEPSPFYSTCYVIPGTNEKSCGGAEPEGNFVSLYFYDHPGMNVSFNKKSETIGQNDSDTVTMTISVSPDAPTGTYWVEVSPLPCLGGQFFLLTIGDCPYHGIS